MGTEQTKMLERVRALLAKADGTNFPEEAATFRAKADELMTKFSIDRWAVKHAQDQVGKSAQPERRDFAATWNGTKFGQDLLDMFIVVADHCRCVAGWRGRSYDSVPVYGLPSDLDYLELLFTTLNLEVAKNMDPPVNPLGEVGAEVFQQRQAGITWPRITEKMYKAGLVKLSKAEIKKLDEAIERANRYTSNPQVREDDRPDWDLLNRVDHAYGSEIGPVRTSMKNRLANANRRYVRENGLEADRNYVKPEVYQRSFMMGFRSEIRDRIYAMSEASRTAYDAEHEAGSMALAVRDIREQAMELYKQEFPPPPPVDLSGVKLRPGRAMKVREVRVDYGAMGKGRAAGKKADLSNNPGRRVETPKKGIGR